MLDNARGTAILAVPLLSASELLIRLLPDANACYPGLTTAGLFCSARASHNPSFDLDFENVFVGGRFCFDFVTSTTAELLRFLEVSAVVDRCQRDRFLDFVQRCLRDERIAAAVVGRDRL